MPDPNPMDDALKKVQLAVEAAKHRILPKMGTIAVNFVHENFEKEGFQGEVFEPWTERKKETKKTLGKPVLTFSAFLRNNTRFYTLGDAVVVHNNAPYAQIHNEGGTIHHGERTQIMNFARGRGGGLKLGKIQTLKQRERIVAQNKATIGAHATEMSQRQFLGYSPVLVTRILDMINMETIAELKKM